MGVKKKWGYKKNHQKKVWVKMKVGVKKKWGGGGNVGKEISLKMGGGQMSAQMKFKGISK